MGTALMIVQGVKLRRELRWQIGTGPITFSSGSRPRSLDLRRILIQNWQTSLRREETLRRDYGPR
jgi:hypothetical protein